MNRPIKFRGRVPEGYHHYGGQIVYGSLVMFREDDYWAQGYPNWIVPFDERRAYPVDEDSVAQLVGYDCDGREVYEGDTLVDADGNKHVARLESVTQNPDTAEFHLWTCPSKLKLTEATT